MGLFSSLKKKKEEKKQKQLFADKWNKLCEMWSNGLLSSPYNELFTYDSYVQGGGHFYFFANNKTNLNDLIKILLDNLPSELASNLEEAFSKYKILKYVEDDFSKYDDFYYDNEELLISILEDYAQTLE